VEQAWQRLLAAEEQRLALVTARYDAGEVDVSTWQQTAANVQQQRSQALAAAANTRQLHYALSALLGRAPQLLPVSEEELLALENAPPKIGVISATVLLQRPDVRAAANVLAATNQRIGAARAAFLPQVSLNATAGFAGPVWSDVFTWNNRTWSAGPVVSLPIFQGGAIRANLRRSWGTYEEAVGNYRGTVLSAMQEAADTVTTNALAGEQASSAKQAYAAIGRSVAATEARFLAGDVGRYEELGATVAAAQAEVAYAQAQAGWHVATLRVVSALGGDWQQR
jgi:outer membrane protein TolC